MDKICKIRIDGDEEQITEVCKRLSKVMLIADRSRFYPNTGSNKGRCYLTVSIANNEHFQ